MTPARVDAVHSATREQVMDSGTPLAFRFTGSGGEYFKIWIVNNVLTILTLGIYSAWAKVRTKSYFYRNTFLQEASFEYRADPMKILKGRLIIGGLFLIALVSQHFSPKLYAAMFVLFILLLPALLALSTAFNARYSYYRNVSFGFVGTFAGAYKAIFLGGLIHLVTLGLGFPVMQWMISRYFVGNHRYGNSSFQWRASISQFYGVYLKALAILLPGLCAIVLAVFSMIPAGSLNEPPDFDPSKLALLIVAFAVFYVSILLATGYVQAELANTVLGSTLIGPHRVHSNQGALAVIWIVLSNTILVALSFGLMHPWAKVRMTRYRMNHLRLERRGDLVVEAEHDVPVPGPLGDAVTDLGDFDFDIGF